MPPSPTRRFGASSHSPERAAFVRPASIHHVLRAPKDQVDAMPQEQDALKELKVRIPVAHHVKLHQLKILRGKNMGDAMQEALDAYFASIRPPLPQVPA